MLGRDLTITATYRVSDRIRYYPRTGYTKRIVGGVFGGTNVDPVNGTYTGVYTVRATPPLARTAVDVNLGNYQYLRHRGPNGSYGKVAEIEFYRRGVKITGTSRGTIKIRAGRHRYGKRNPRGKLCWRPTVALRCL
jgi:hypothetical protein